MIDYVYIYIYCQKFVPPGQTSQCVSVDVSVHVWYGSLAKIGMVSGCVINSTVSTCPKTRRSWVIKCPHFSHHPTNKGIWSFLWLLFWVMSNIPKSWDSDTNPWRSSTLFPSFESQQAWREDHRTHPKGLALHDGKGLGSFPQLLEEKTRRCAGRWMMIP